MKRVKILRIEFDGLIPEVTTDITTPVQEATRIAVNALRDVREGWSGADGAEVELMEAELNLERIVDLVMLVTYKKEA